MPIRHLVLALLCSCAGAPIALGAEQGELSLGVGLNYSSGEYGTGTTTRIISIPFMARYERGPLTLKLTVPWLQISGGTSVIPGIGPVSNSNPKGRGRSGATEATVSGLGDTVAAATYNAFYDSSAKVGVDVTGRVKLATADADEGLGTGQNDYGAQVDAYRTIDRTTVFGGIGYTVLGSSSFIELRNVWSVNVGASYKLDQQDSFGLSADARQRASTSSDPQRELTALWARKIDKALKAQAYVLKGFANGSPDWGAGVTLLHAY